MTDEEPLTKKVALAQIQAHTTETVKKLRKCNSEWARNLVFVDAVDELQALARKIAHQLPKE